MANEFGKKKPFALHLWNVVTGSCIIKQRIENPYHLFPTLYFPIMPLDHVTVQLRFGYFIYSKNKHVLSTCYVLVLRIKII